MKLMRTILAALMGVAAMLGGAQEQALMWAEQLPMFPGGSEALARALVENIILPINFGIKENPVDRETEDLYRNGLRNLFGLEATPVDYSIARDYLKRAAMRGHPQAKALIRQYNF